jgi:hypothetical protein
VARSGKATVTHCKWPLATARCKLCPSMLSHLLGLCLGACHSGLHSFRGCMSGLLQSSNGFARWSDGLDSSDLMNKGKHLGSRA